MKDHDEKGFSFLREVEGWVSDELPAPPVSHAFPRAVAI